MGKDRIFVSVVSYRDPECQWTLRDLFLKAAVPERIRVGVVWQLDPEVDGDCDVFSTCPRQVRALRIDAAHSQGACWARHLAQSLWEGEDYYLQIDSHMRFEPGWDCLLLEQYQACANPRAVLSSYPPEYEPPEKLFPCVTRIVAREFSELGMLVLGSRGKPAGSAHTAPVPGAFVSAGFLFADAALIAEVPYDPFIYFQGEEIALAARLWTAGWDIYAPGCIILYHNYRVREVRRRSRHWEDHADWPTLNHRSLNRVRHLLGTPCADARALREIAHYGLGAERTLAEYETHCGVVFSQQMIAERARKGVYS